ncbi:Delta(1)-pyrroline-2-carboxylate reductase [Sporomusa rhizae]|uniref:ornithine cyclodeaminase family protein n=1 Tax=Sporomusa rhizae TaxID=357999 RepID=UPI00352BA66E
MSEIIVLTDQDVASLISFDENMHMVEQAFHDYSLGKSYAFPVVREEITKHTGIFGIKSGYLESQDVLGFKAGGFWTNNKGNGLPNHQSAIMLFNPSTGQPTAIVAANFVTQVRTAAIGAIGCKYLARKNSKILAVIGNGQQGRNQLEAALTILPDIKEVYLFDAYPEASQNLLRDIVRYPLKLVIAESAEQACRNADVIITATSSYQPIVLDEWIKPGTHINAIGTDTRGKQELDPRIFARATVVVDDINQCCYLGECQHAYDAGIITKDAIYGQIGELINANKQGRRTDEEITVFDTTGVAIQDLATAGYAVSEAVKKGIGQKITL